jgi:quercetin dioxygenase-like cupin family protein
MSFLKQANPAFGPDPMLKEIVELTGRDEERMWVPEPEFPDVFWRPLMFDIANGNHVEIMKVRKGGRLGRHLHTTPVHGFVLSGSWHYLEHDWVAEKGAYVFEPAGEAHTLHCDAGEEMVTLFFINGPIIYLHDDDRVAFIDDNRSLIDRARAHYARVGIGADLVDRLFR